MSFPRNSLLESHGLLNCDREQNVKKFVFSPGEKSLLSLFHVFLLLTNPNDSWTTLVQQRVYKAHSLTCVFIASLKSLGLVNNPVPTESLKVIQSCGKKYGRLSKLIFRVPHGSRPHGYDRHLDLCVNDPTCWKSTPVLQSTPWPDEARSLVVTETYGLVGTEAYRDICRHRLRSERRTCNHRGVTSTQVYF